MKTVTGRVTSEKPISLSKAATLLSSFVSSETEASQDVAAYLRRASDAFTELKSFHREIRSSTKPAESEPRFGENELEDEKRKSREEDAVEEKETVKWEEEPRKKERKKKSREEDVVEEKVDVKLEEEQRNDEKKKKKSKKNKGEDVNVKLEEEQRNEERKEKKKNKGEDVVDEKVNEERNKKKKKKRKSDGEIGSEERKTKKKKKRKSKEID
ncbi:hypothetical protein Bca4012_025516 [Brassica carinata]|uniref:Uncharacterized protein n=1 Tax=Brassica carinata TaxID=52824 RepID=A0A8X7VGV3_BRACI|nr:hypothetical protein Bca52824_022608 [Brassica carinata]